MAELSIKANQQISSSTQSLLDKLSSLKREAYSHLDQALTFDSSTPGAPKSSETKCDTAIIMYERCLRYIDDTLAFYQTNRAEFSGHDDAIRVYNHLVSMKNQTNERLNALKDERMRLVNGKSSKLTIDNTDGFLDIGDEILNDDDCVIIDDLSGEEAARAVTPEVILSLTLFILFRKIYFLLKLCLFIRK